MQLPSFYRPLYLVKKIMPERKQIIYTVMSPNIARPLILRTSTNDYATFSQIKSFSLFNSGLLVEREKQQKVFHSMLSLQSMGGFWQNLENVVSDHNFR